ncbi:MAG: hypothetical protein M1826_003331 [Phylliscum demangeonii]|nr:MAG: hypothetical protein M1826_003331 [Phylliscum demangeonii]
MVTAGTNGDGRGDWGEREEEVARGAEGDVNAGRVAERARAQGQGQAPARAPATDAARATTSPGRRGGRLWTRTRTRTQPPTQARPLTSPAPTPAPTQTSPTTAEFRAAAPRPRDSGLGTTVSTVSHHSSVMRPDDDVDDKERASPSSSPPAVCAHDSVTSLPAITVDPHRAREPRTGARTRSTAAGELPDHRGGGSIGGGHDDGRLRISLEIPSAPLFHDGLLDNMAFSNRGSILLGAGSRSSWLERRRSHARPDRAPPPPAPAPATGASADERRALSLEENTLSQQVRDRYEACKPAATRARGAAVVRPGAERAAAAAVVDQVYRTPERDGRPSTGAGDAVGARHAIGEGDEPDGGLEDWDDLAGMEVDRYGFIVARKPSSAARSSTPGSPATTDGHRPQRVSTLLQLASEAPRRHRGLVRKSSPPSRRLSRSATPQARPRDASRSSGRRPAPASSAAEGVPRFSLHPFRYAATHLPGNRDKRCLHEAGDMLTAPPALAAAAAAAPELMASNGPRAGSPMKQKEWARAAKWQKMARLAKPGTDGGGMVFDFDVNHPKITSRTWKGIPDRWRATAWHSFLSSSAKAHADSASDAEIIARFHELLDQSSADDVQIDMDVPRTINRHIMFRRRYRGGQRLLFRLLHSLSLYFPVTGYVQGMASLAATLLCYYDEEMAFVMLVRLWQVRGLERLYLPGFHGLMEALADFETHWLADGAVAKRLADLNIDVTAYGTRWYLTLFSYSIPFAAQLRVWDIFMLLGGGGAGGGRSPPVDDPDHGRPSSSASRPATTPTASASGSTAASLGQYDILHAASAALMDGMTDILLASDFESAMKVLTSWIPIRDEELLMKVARVEWKLRRRRR